MEEIVKKYYDNGQIESEKTFINGLKNGIGKAWYEDGKLKYDAVYIDDKIKFMKYFNKEGFLEIEKVLIRQNDNGVDVYELNWYYDNGNIYIKETLVNNKCNGLYKRWFDDGQLFIETCYKDDKMHGEYKEYNRKGDLVYSCNYIDGEQI